MYKHRPIEEAKPGDVVESVETDYSEDDENVTTVTKGKLYIIQPGTDNNLIGQFIDDTGELSGGISLSSRWWKLLETKPGSEAKVGDTVISLTDMYKEIRMIGTTHKVLDVGSSIKYETLVKYFDSSSRHSEFLILVQEETSISDDMMDSIKYGVPTPTQELPIYKAYRETKGKIMNKIKTYLAYIILLLSMAIAVSIVIAYAYSQRYVQDSTNTATTGVFFKKTLNLDAYQNVANGNGWLGNYNRYSRSLNHSDVITVYCNKYCKK